MTIRPAPVSLATPTTSSAGVCPSANSRITCGTPAAVSRARDLIELIAIGDHVVGFLVDTSLPREDDHETSAAQACLLHGAVQSRPTLGASVETNDYVQVITSGSRTSNLFQMSGLSHAKWATPRWTGCVTRTWMMIDLALTALSSR